MRTPAWCDRVLWRAGPGAARLLQYDRAPLHPSDHKPVFAVFACSLKRVQQSQQRRVFEALRDSLRSLPDQKPEVEVRGLSVCVEGLLYEVGNALRAALPHSRSASSSARWSWSTRAAAC